MKAYGEKIWLIPDAFIPSAVNTLISHDAVCVINTSDIDANIKLTLFFENEAKISDIHVKCGKEKTHHIRMDRLTENDKPLVPRDTPYAIMVESDTEIVVQYSRLDSTQADLALMTTIAYPIK